VDLHKKLARVKVQYLSPDGSWRTGNFFNVDAKFNEGDQLLAGILYKAVLRDETTRKKFWRHADENTQIRVVKTTVYQDHTDGYAGREIHTHEVLAGPRSAKEDEEMRIYT
jgi:hypothetical protein